MKAHFWGVNRRLIFILCNEFKNKLANHLKHEKNLQNIATSSSSYSNYVIPRRNQSKYPPLPRWLAERSECKYCECSAHGGNYPNHLRHRHSIDSLASGVQFFIGEERKHYNLLNNHVFGPLSIISLPDLNRAFTDDNVVFPNYRIPTFEHFEDARLHMKKDKNALESQVATLFNRIRDFNTAANEANTQIDQLITAGILQAGFAEANEDFNNINTSVRSNLRTDIYPAADVRMRALQFNPSLGALEISELARNTIIQLVRDENIIEQVATVKRLEVEIIQAINLIRQTAEPISKAITEEYYDTRTDCCPTYWTLLSRFF